jgi:methylenetetrahydrofolate--tRNA-(uracil-5-)-methyltransferase
MQTSSVIVIGAGLAGSEAAWALAQHGCRVTLFEMRPQRSTPAHTSDRCAELVCSNSFRSNAPEHAIGTLKEEMRALGSLTMAAAAIAEVPSGKGLAVDRDLFAQTVTQQITTHPLITVRREEVESLQALRTAHPGVPIIVATGPLTAEKLAQDLQAITATDDLYFYDSMAPLVATASIDTTKMFRASRYDAGDGPAYWNAPLTRDEYVTFVMALIRADKVPPRDFEDPKYFEGCLPIEVMAERGVETLRHGPMKPFGLKDPRTGREADAVIQFRDDNREGTILNIVGFQTRMTWTAQRDIFHTIPGLANAEFLRMGAMHRNTYLNSPRLLDTTLALKACPGVHCAGQIIGVEGYVESAALGLFLGWWLAGKMTRHPPRSTALGSLLHHVTNGNPERFEPMNANWGLTPPLPPDVPYRGRRLAYQTRAAGDFAAWREAQGISPDNCVALRQAMGIGNITVNAME